MHSIYIKSTHKGNSELEPFLQNLSNDVPSSFLLMRTERVRRARPVIPQPLFSPAFVSLKKQNKTKDYHNSDVWKYAGKSATPAKMQFPWLL